MTPMAPHITAFVRERLPRPRGARAQTCARDAYTLQRLVASVSQRLHRKPSKHCLEHLDAPMVMDVLASLEAEHGTSPRTRHPRLAAITSFMRVVEYRVPSIREQSRRV